MPDGYADLDHGGFLRRRPVGADRQVAELIELSAFDVTCIERRSRRGTDTCHDGVGIMSAPWEWAEATDQLRITIAELSAYQRSITDSSQQWFALDKP